MCQLQFRKKKSTVWPISAVSRVLRNESRIKQILPISTFEINLYFNNFNSACRNMSVWLVLQIPRKLSCCGGLRNHPQSFLFLDFIWVETTNVCTLWFLWLPTDDICFHCEVSFCFSQYHRSVSPSGAEYYGWVKSTWINTGSTVGVCCVILAEDTRASTCYEKLSRNL